MTSPSIRTGHVGLCVADLDAAADWYVRVLGLRLLEGPVELRGDDATRGPALADVFGQEFAVARVAHLVAADGVGLELFEFVDPRTTGSQPSYRRAGLSHLCFVTPDIEELAARIEVAGGRRRTAFWHERPEAPYRYVHLEDPFGNLLELHSHPSVEVYGR